MSQHETVTQRAKKQSLENSMLMSGDAPVSIRARHGTYIWSVRHRLNPRTYAESIVLVTTVDMLMHDGGETRLGHSYQVPSARTLLFTCFSRSIEIFNQVSVLLHSEEVSSKCEKSVNERKRSETRHWEKGDKKGRVRTKRSTERHMRSAGSDG